MGEMGTVIVAMSGGVDSSVAAGLLKREGYSVVGVTLRLNPCRDQEGIRFCCGKGADEQAREVAGILGIPHYTVDYSAKFEENILKPAWEEYFKGRTPSPCIACNRDIKFKALSEMAAVMSASKIATGHYAIVERTEDGSSLLLRGVDTNKDQSYFLFELGPGNLSRALFPLGPLRKSEVRRIAASMGFANADRKESQDACFVTEEGSFPEALRMRFGGQARPGYVVDTRGNKLGTHDGIHRFTVGQRKGLGIALGKRAYVSRIDAETGEVELCDDAQGIKVKHVVASNTSFLGDMTAGYSIRCQAQIRYRHKAADAVATLDQKGTLHVEFDVPQGAAAPGQALVLFDGPRVLGGGWIDRS